MGWLSGWIDTMSPEELPGIALSSDPQATINVFSKYNIHYLKKTPYNAVIHR